MAYRIPDCFVLSAKIRVRYSETDKMGIVYNANYLIWFEIARTEYCRQWGISYSTWEKKELFLPVVEAYCRFKRPARYDDTVSLYCHVPPDSIKYQSICFEYLIIQEDKETILLAEGWTKHAITNSNGQIYRTQNPLEKWLLDKMELGNN